MGLSFLKKRVLIVEDDSVLRCELEETLTQAGYKVQAIACGSKFIGSVQLFKPHVILLDERLPRVSGVEALRVLRSDQMGNHTPVIFMGVGRVDTQLQTDLTRLGAVFIEKTHMQLEKLIQLVDKHMQTNMVAA